MQFRQSLQFHRVISNHWRHDVSRVNAVDPNLVATSASMQRSRFGEVTDCAFTADTLHRRDLVCRILAKAAGVWRLMLEDLGSRYVVFEFKNYSKSLTQNEIVTTERYLYPSALRKVSIVISHEDCADSAKAVIAGAMREHGKLIIPLSVPEIIDLLNSKDEGSDPNSSLISFFWGLEGSTEDLPLRLLEPGPQGRPRC